MIRAERGAGWGRQPRRTRGRGRRGRGAGQRAGSPAARPGPAPAAPAPAPLSPPSLSLAQLIAPEDSRLTSQLLSSGLGGPPAHLLRTSPAGTVTHLGFFFIFFFPSLLLKPKKALDSDVTFQREGREKKIKKTPNPQPFLSSTTSRLSPKENLLAWPRQIWWGPEPETDHSLIDKEIPAQTGLCYTTSLRQAHFTP